MSFIWEIAMYTKRPAAVNLVLKAHEAQKAWKMMRTIEHLYRSIIAVKNKVKATKKYKIQSVKISLDCVMEFVSKAISRPHNVAMHTGVLLYSNAVVISGGTNVQKTAGTILIGT